ncbi:MAG: radical SAM protein [Schwartzia succinivorans]|nr:radical SAM protein [Schwartzia succinivorans]
MDLVFSHQILIFGFADIGRKLYDLIKAQNPLVELTFCDNSSTKHGAYADGFYVVSVDEAVQKFPEATFVIASLWHSEQMKQQLLAAGVQLEQIITDLPKEIVEAAREAERRRRVGKRETLRFEININKHCNLNCKGCDHFAPLSTEDCMDLSVYERDMKRMAELFHGEAWQIHLLGGEPLLNPNLMSYARIARECFPHAEIWIDTNGTLLQRMPEEFWDACKKYRLGIMPTKYPVAVDYDELQRMTEAHGVPYQYLGSSESGRTLWHFPLDLTGGQDMRDSFLNCRNANQCLTLENGRLYTCSIAPNIKAFNEYFNQHLDLTEDDGIDIHCAQSGDEVLAAMARPMPFCRYCDVKHRTYDHPWEVSRQDIREWTNGN